MKNISRHITSKSLFCLAVIILNIFLGINIFASIKRTNSFFRIHVVANSDSPSDQIIKYKVVQVVENFLDISTELKDATSKTQAKEIVEDNISNIYDLAIKSLNENGVNLPVTIKFGNIHYDEKKSKHISMPQGIYDSIQVVIGDGNGENWWSIIYPKSYVNNIVLDDKKDEENITYNDISSSNRTIIKSKIFEFFKKIFY